MAETIVHVSSLPRVQKSSLWDKRPPYGGKLNFESYENYIGYFFAARLCNNWLTIAFANCLLRQKIVFYVLAPSTNTCHFGEIIDLLELSGQIWSGFINDKEEEQEGEASITQRNSLSTETPFNQTPNLTALTNGRLVIFDEKGPFVLVSSLKSYVAFVARHPQFKSYVVVGNLWRTEDDYLDLN